MLTPYVTFPFFGIVLPSMHNLAHGPVQKSLQAKFSVSANWQVKQDDMTTQIKVCQVALCPKITKCDQYYQKNLNKAGQIKKKKIYDTKAYSAKSILPHCALCLGT